MIMTPEPALITSLQLPRELEERLEGKPLVDVVDALIDAGFGMKALALVGSVLGAIGCCRLVHSELRELGGPIDSEEDELLFGLLADWFAEPEEQSRRLALAAAEKLEYATPVAMLAAAIALSEGSLAPEESDQEVRAPEQACISLAIGAYVAAGKDMTASGDLPILVRRFSARGVEAMQAER